MNANRFLKLVIFLYISACLTLLFGPKSLFPSFYKLNFMASLAFVSVFLMLLPSIIFKTSDESKKRTRSALESTTGIFVAGIGWEMLEYLSDFFFDTQLLGGGSAQIFKDTAFDMVANTLGIMTAGIYIILKKNKK